MFISCKILLSFCVQVPNTRYNNINSIFYFYTAPPCVYVGLFGNGTYMYIYIVLLRQADEPTTYPPDISIFHRAIPRVLLLIAIAGTAAVGWVARAGRGGGWRKNGTKFYRAADIAFGRWRQILEVFSLAPRPGLL